MWDKELKKKLPLIYHLKSSQFDQLHFYKTEPPNDARVLHKNQTCP